jgi:copper transport protein
LYQTSVASSSSFWQLFSTNAVFRYMTESHFGTIWLLRLGLIVLAFLVWNYGRRQKSPKSKTVISLMLRGPGCYCLLVSITILFTNSLNSHAAANQGTWFLIPADVLYVVGAGFWMGGLCFFVGMIPVAVSTLVPGTGDRTRLFARLIPRFSRLAIISVGVLSITGVGEAIHPAWVHSMPC